MNTVATLKEHRIKETRKTNICIPQGMPKLIFFIEIRHRVQETGMASDVGRLWKVTYVRMIVMTYSYMIKIQKDILGDDGKQ